MKKTEDGLIRTSKLSAEIQLRPDGKCTEVGFWVGASDGKHEPTGQEILDAVADLINLYWDNNPIKEINLQEYDA